MNSAGSSRRPMTDGESSQSRFNESISRFSPRMSSTKRGQSISEAGAADTGEREPNQLGSQSNDRPGTTNGRKIYFLSRLKLDTILMIQSFQTNMPWQTV